MSENDINRIYTILSEQNKTMREQGILLAKIEESHVNLSENLLGKDGLKRTVTRHSAQINYWRGSVAILFGLWTLLSAAVVAYAAKHH